MTGISKAMQKEPHSRDIEIDTFREIRISSISILWYIVVTILHMLSTSIPWFTPNIH